jgi:hypothetical protein
MTVETVETFPTEQKFDDQELFDHAEEVEAPDTPDAPAAEVEQPEPEAQVSETPAERPVVDDNAPLVPSWRLREINEEKRTLADRLAALEAERATWQRPAPSSLRSRRNSPERLQGLILSLIQTAMLMRSATKSARKL